MMAASSFISELRTSLTDESARIQREFEATGDGRAAVAGRTKLVEDILARLWREIVSPDESKPANFSLVATGGFGRGWLFPYSDIDLLFLFGDREAEQAFKDPVRRFSQELWDLRLKLSPASRTLRRVRSLRPQQYRVYDFSSRLPLSRRRPRSVPPAARQDDSESRDARVQGSAAGTGGSHARAPWEVWHDTLSP